MFGIEKPMPMPNEDTEAYWNACRQQHLVVPKCGGCGHRFLPPAKLCPRCLSTEVAFHPSTGKGRVFSFIVVHRPQHPAFFPDAPYNVAIVELEEGVRMHGRVTGIEHDRIRVGMEVEVVFEKIDDEVTLPLFKPTKTEKTT
jgi:uncharacterized OB-fold protein